jgi:DNA modification methylase
MNAPNLNSATDANSPRIITSENKVAATDDIDRRGLKNLVVIYRRVEDLIPYARNARTYTKKQIKKLAKCIQRFGFLIPIVIDANGVIICGHVRLLAAKQAGVDKIPTIQLEHLSPAEIRAFVIADNRLAEESTWNDEILKIELQNIIIEGVVDVSFTGFEIPEIDIKLGALAEEDPADEIPEEQSAAVTRPGDLWFLDDHRILCADTQDEAAVKRLMGERLAAMVLADPPYNVKIAGNCSGKGIVKHPDFVMACGEMTELEFTAFLERTLGALAQCSTVGSLHYVAMDWRHARELLAAGDKIFDSLLNICVWDKGSGGQGSFYRSQHELFFVFRKGKGQHRNNIQLGRFGRYRTNCWLYPGVRGLSQLQGEEGNLLALHPTVKPVALIADAILDCTAPGDLVLDGFVGSGSTVIAAERVRRTCYGLEISPHYVDVAIRRWQRYRGAHAVLAATGQTFDDRAAEVGRG